jgi:hypothetical protein
MEQDAPVQAPAWYCSCGFLNEGLDQECSSCGISLEEAQAEAWRHAQEAARGEGLHLGGEGAAPYPAASGGVIFAFLAGEPDWRLRLLQSGALGAWFAEPAPRLAAALMLLAAWLGRIAMWAAAAAALLLGVFQLVAGTSMAAGPDLKDPQTWVNVIEPQEAEPGEGNTSSMVYTVTNLTQYPIKSVTIGVAITAKDGTALWSGSGTLNGLAPGDTAQLRISGFATDSFFQRGSIKHETKVTVDPDVALTAATAADEQAAAHAAAEQPPSAAGPDVGQPDIKQEPSHLITLNELPAARPAAGPGPFTRLLNLLGLNDYSPATPQSTNQVLARGLILLVLMLIYAVLLVFAAEAYFHGLAAGAGLLIAAINGRDTLIAKRGLDLWESLEREAPPDYAVASAQAAENVLVLLRLVLLFLFLLGWAAAITMSLLGENHAALLLSLIVPPLSWLLSDLALKVSLSWPFAARTMAALSRLAKRAA